MTCSGSGTSLGRAPDTEIEEQPDGANEGHQKQQAPPAAAAKCVATLHRNGNLAIDRESTNEDAAGQSDDLLNGRTGPGRNQYDPGHDTNGNGQGKRRCDGFKEPGPEMLDAANPFG